MKFEVLSLLNKKEWGALFSKLPIEQQDIYFTPEYYELYENNGDGKAQCFVFEENDEIALYPFLINSVNELGYDLDNEYFDIQGAYGYNGIVSTTIDKDFINLFSKSFNIFCSNNNIIAEFQRINPIIDNISKYRKDMDVIYNNENILVNLSNEDILNTYEYSVRKNIKKAITNNLEYYVKDGNNIINEELNAFYNIYVHTMQRTQAEDFYYLNKHFFKSAASLLKEKSLFAFVKKDNKIMSCELILLGANVAYSYLGGTFSEYYQYRPNDYLKYKSIERLKELGYNYFLLGGGPEGVLKYKKKFAPNGIISFYIGKKIHNQKIYDEVVKQWETKFPEKKEKYNNLLLKYRY
jgi:hypothetical protein